MTTKEVTLFGTRYENLQEGLHAIANGLPIIPTQETIWGMCDAILEHLHSGMGIFELSREATVHDVDHVIWYQETRSQITMREISTNFWGRVPYDSCMQNGMRGTEILALLRLCGESTPPQFLCCVAAYDLSNTASWRNAPGERLNWTKLLIKSQGHSVVVDGKVINDVRGLSIIDIASTANFKYIFKSILDAGIDSVFVQQNTISKINAEAAKDPKLAALLSKVSVHRKQI